MERDTQHRLGLFLAVILGHTSCATAAVPPPQSFFVFPRITPTSQSYGYGISSNGYAVASRTPAGISRYVPGIGVQNLDKPSSGNNIGVFGVNSHGTMVGSASGGSPSNYVFRYDDGVGYSILTTGSSSANGYAISDSGFITGETNSHAFLYSQSTGIVTLGNSAQVGYAVNESGQVTGFGGTTLDRAFLYTPGVGVQYLSPPVGNRSYGRGINDLGQVLLEAVNNSLATIGAYIYTPGAGYALLPQTANTSLAMHDINNRGWVVGRLTFGALWLPGESAPVDLTSYVRTYFGGSLTIWDAEAVNDQGQIVGWAKDASGKDSAFILTIPGPGTLGFLGYAALGLRRHRRATN